MKLDDIDLLNYRLFLSHSSKDKSFVSWLALRLEEHNLKVWYDDWEIDVGDSIIDKISEGLRFSDIFVPIFSHNSIRSRWFKEELNYATIKRITDNGIRILPVCIDKCEIPPLLRHLRYADFRYSEERGLQQIYKALVPRTNEANVKLDLVFEKISNILTAQHPSDPELVGNIVFELDYLFDAALYWRYIFEKLRNDELPVIFEGFFKQLEYIEKIGINVKNPTWALLRSLPVDVYHGGISESEREIRIKQLWEGGKSLLETAQIICYPKNS